MTHGFWGVPAVLSRGTLTRFQLGGYFSGKKKAHKHKLFCPVGLGTTPGLSRGFHRVCPWDKPGLSQGQSRGRRAAHKVYVKRVYVPFSLANFGTKCPRFHILKSLFAGSFQSIFYKCLAIDLSFDDKGCCKDSLGSVIDPT